MSAMHLFLALEAFQEQQAATLVSETPTIEVTAEFDENVTAESDAIDQDMDGIQSSAQALEDIISLVQEAPGGEDAPLEPYVQRAVNVAMEANDLVASSGNQLALTADKGATKKDFLDKAKDFAKKIWAMLTNMAGKILEWIRGVWAKVTDRLVKNANKAKKYLEVIKGLNTRAGAKIDNEKLLKAAGSAGGKDVGEVVLNVFEHAKRQSEKAAKQLTQETALLIEAIAGGKNNNEPLLEKFVELLANGAGGFSDKASAAQAQATQSPSGSVVLVSEEFFEGKRAWLCAPENADELGKWNHGLSQLDESKPAPAAAPDVRELQGICEYLLTGQDIVRIYQAAAKDLDAIHARLKSATSKSSDSADKKQLQAMQAVIPRIIKGPQVAAYNYAGTASTIALAYVEASLKAHQAPAEAPAKAAE